MKHTDKLNLFGESQKEQELTTINEKYKYLVDICRKGKNFQEINVSHLYDFLTYFNKLNSRYIELKESNEMLKNQHLELLQKYNNVLLTCQRVNTLKPKQRQISDDDIKHIKTLKNQGLSYKKISTLTGWSTATISRAVNGFYGV